jgi:hypothetical protein
MNEHSHDHVHEPHSHLHEDDSIERYLVEEAHAKASLRASYAILDDSQLELIHDQIWHERATATAKLLAITEELLGREVVRNIPDAVTLILVEDTSHGQPHGHISVVLDEHGNVLHDGMSDAWHDLPWTTDIDELVWDVHTLGREAFRHDGTGRRTRTIPV